MSELLDDIRAFRHFLEAERGMAANTVLAYGRDLERFAMWADNGGLRNYLKPSVRDLSHYVAHLNEEQLASPSIARRFALPGRSIHVRTTSPAARRVPAWVSVISCSFRNTFPRSSASAARAREPILPASARNLSSLTPASHGLTVQSGIAVSSLELCHGRPDTRPRALLSR
jgi:hypothetical protein